MAYSLTNRPEEELKLCPYPQYGSVKFFSSIPVACIFYYSVSEECFIIKEYAKLAKEM